MNYIGKTILTYPRAVMVSAQPSGWLPMSWQDFAEANPEIADEVALDIALRGVSHVGGGAAPLITILRGA